MGRRILAIALSVFAALAVSSAAKAQVSVSATAGSPGIGADLGYQINDTVGVRLTGAYFGLSDDVDVNDIKYSGHLRLMSFGGLVDVFAIDDSGLRLSGGAYYDRNRITIHSTPTTAVTIGNTLYAAGMLGQVAGDITFRDVAPYAGLGYTSLHTEKGWGFTMDAGVMFQGGPKVALAASGPATLLPGFSNDLATERQKISDEVDWLKYYPVIRIGLVYRF